MTGRRYQGVQCMFSDGVFSSSATIGSPTAMGTSRIRTEVSYAGTESATVAIGPEGTALTTAQVVAGLPPATDVYAAIIARGYSSTGGLLPIELRSFLTVGDVANDTVSSYGKATTLTSSTATRVTAEDRRGDIAVFEGDRPYLPPSGRSGRPTRLIVGLSRQDFRDGPDPAPIDAFSVDVFATPRYLQIPDTSAPKMTGLLPSDGVLPDDDLLPH
jgi:hypothetical protein